MQSATFRGVTASTAPHHLDIAASDHAAQTEMFARPDRLMEKLATTASSRDDDDIKEMDSWRQSDASDVSSRVTTPDPQPPSRSRPPLSSSTTETQTPHGSRTPAIPIPGALPPPPPPPRLSRLRYFQRFSQPRRGPELPHNLVPGQIYSTNDSTHALSQTFPSADSFRYNLAPAIPSSHAFPPPLPPTEDQLSSNHRTSSVPVMHRSLDTQPESRPQSFLYSGPLRSPVPNITNGNGVVLQPREQIWPDMGLNKMPMSSSLTWPQKPREESLSSEYTSGEDPFEYRNARQFPPQLPAQLSSHMSTTRSRSSATNRITNWVSKYEKSHSPARIRRQETATPVISVRPESDGAKSQVSAVSSHAAVEQLWQQLKQKRAKLREIREHMTRRRLELRDLRRRKDDADNAFMMVIRPLLVSQRSDAFLSSLQLLDSRMATMLKLREEYHFSESAYENLEHDLDEEESELSGLETRFFSLLAAGQDGDAQRSLPVRKPTTETNASADTDTPYYLIGISADKPLEDIHPLYVEFSTAVGDLGNAKEEYDDLLFVNAQYEEDKDIREGTGRNLTADAEEFFAEFADEESRMKASIGELEAEVQRLKRICEEKGAMRKFLSIPMSYILNPDKTYEDMDLEDTRDILAKNQTLKHPRYSELLSQPNNLLESPGPLTAEQALAAVARLPNDDPLKNHKQRLAAKEHAIETLVQSHASESTADLVNRWLLHQLRRSPLNILLLQSIFGSECGLKIKDYWRWQCDVMYYWWRDDTTQDQAADKHSISEMSEYSARQGSPQQSRAASDSDLHVKRKSMRHFKSSEMLRII